jgi:rhomboid protease GluP
MGVMSLAFLLAGRADTAKRARIMRWTALRIGVPAILPVFITGASHGHVDYGAHIGGFLTGGLVWLFLGLIWPRAQPRPALGGVAALIAAAGGGAALVAFGVAMAAPAPVTEIGTLIPTAQFPRTTADGLQRSAELAARWPDDPRAHYLRGLYFLQQRDLSDASDQLRAGIALMPRHKSELQPDLGYRMGMTLALIVGYQGDLSGARAIAAEGCGAPEARRWDLRADLVQRHICD